MTSNFKKEKSHLVAFVVVFVAIALILTLYFASSAEAAFNNMNDIPAGYSPPWNIFANDAQFLTVNVGDATNNAVPITVDASQTGMIFYKYYYISENGVWQSHTFSQNTIGSSSWIADEASATFNIDQSALGEGSDNYVVTYACAKENGAWKCGCSAPTVCNQWSIQDFTNPVSDELPDCVPDPKCSGKADGDTFCVASQPSQVYTCFADADGCLVASSDACASGETCVASDDTATCLPTNPQECIGPAIPDPSTIACGESQTIDSCGQNIIVEGTQCDSGTCVDGACITEPPLCEVPLPSGDAYPCGTTNPYNYCDQPINITGTNCDSGTCQNGVCVEGDFTYCSEASKETQACPDVSIPVCAAVSNIECLTPPCPTTDETYGNACVACQKPNVIGYTDGPCPTEPQQSTCLSADECWDHNSCTTDSCTTTGVCQNTVKADGTSCASQYGTGGTCQDGVCIPTSVCDAPRCYDDIGQVCRNELVVRALNNPAEGQVCVNGEWGPHVPLQ